LNCLAAVTVHEGRAAVIIRFFDSLWHSCGDSEFCSDCTDELGRAGVHSDGRRWYCRTNSVTLNWVACTIPEFLTIIHELANFVIDAFGGAVGAGATFVWIEITVTTRSAEHEVLAILIGLTGKLVVSVGVAIVTRFSGTFESCKAKEQGCESLSRQHNEVCGTIVLAIRERRSLGGIIYPAVLSCLVDYSDSNRCA
jgi:hypothetical protein